MKLRGKSNSAGGDPSFGNENASPFSSMSAAQSMSAMGMGHPIRRSKPIYARIKRGMYWAIPAGLVLITLSVLSTFIRVNSVASAVNQRFSDSYNPSFKVKYEAMGVDIIQSWFANGPAPVNYGTRVQWPGTTSIKNNASNPEALNNQSAGVSTKSVPDLKNITFVSGYQQKANLSDDMVTTSKDKFKNPREEILTYRALYNSQVMNISINLMIPDVLDPETQPILISNPTMAPAEPGTSDSSGVSSDPRGAGMDTSNMSPQAKSVLQQWTTAWAEDQRVALKQLAQDQSNKTYRGLGGWSTQKGAAPTILWQYGRTIDEDDSKYIVAEVEFPIVQSFNQKLPGQTAGDNKPTVEQNYSSTQTMNVLIGKPDSGLPSVVAWGPSGSWESLVPFGNGTVPKDSSTGLSQPTSSVNRPGGDTTTSTSSPTTTASPTGSGGIPDPLLPPGS